MQGDFNPFRTLFLFTILQVDTVIVGGDAFFGKEGFLELNAHIVGGTGHIDLIRVWF